MLLLTDLFVLGIFILWDRWSISYHCLYYFLSCVNWDQEQDIIYSNYERRNVFMTIEQTIFCIQEQWIVICI